MAEVRMVDENVVEALRAVADGSDDTEALLVLEAAGVWSPIEREERPNGRAHCRGCGNLIPKGADAVRFGFDPPSAPVSTSGWGSMATAYVHATFCPPEGAQTGGGGEHG